MYIITLIIDTVGQSWRLFCLINGPASFGQELALPVTAEGYQKSELLTEVVGYFCSFVSTKLNN